MNNNLNVAVTAGLDKSRSVAQINQDIQKIEAQLKKLKLQATLEKGKSISEIQSQINVLNKQKRNLFVDLKIRQKDLKRQYRQAIANIHTQPLNVDVNTAAAQSQMTGLTNSVKTTTSETVTLADSLKKALSNTGLVISSQTALQLVRKAAQEATEAVREYDKYATNLSIITGGSKESSYETIADLSEKSFDFKVDVSELEGAYETLLRTGKAAGELDDYLKSTVFLSKVGFEDMDTSAENLVTIGNAFKLQSDEIENVVSSLVALDTASNTVAGKLSTAMSKTAQNAQLAGLNIDQLGAIISGLRDTTGRSESELATSLNGILTRLYNVKLGKYKIELEDGSTEDITESLNNVEDMLKTVGMNIRTSKGEFKDVADIIDELVTKWDKLNDVQKNAVGFTFAGTYHKNTFISLVENWERIKELTDISADSAGQASEKYNAYLDSVEAKSAALNTAVKDMWNNLIPNNLAGDLTEAATGVVQFTDKYQVLQTALKSAAFYALAKGIVTAKNGITGLVTDIKNVSSAMSLATQSGAMTMERMSGLAAVTKGLTDKQLTLILSSSNLSEAQMIEILRLNGVTEAEAKQKLATLGITQANTTATASTFSLSGAFKALWASIAANPIGALTIAFTGLVTIYQTVKRKQEEQIEEIKETADKAKELTDNINELYRAYTDMKTGVENGTESKENLTTATNNLLEALGYEGTAIDELVDKYGNLSDAINQTTADTLKNSLPDLANAVDVELGELLETGSNVVSFTLDDTKANKELNDFVKKLSDKTAGLNMLHGTSDSTFRVIVDTDKNSAEGLKQELDILNDLRNELFNYYGAENIQDIDFYKQLTDRITKLTEAYNDYSQSLKNYNDTAAQAQIIESLVGKEIPQTVEEYKAYRQELINSAKNSGQFIGSQEDIINAIDGTLGKMSEFETIQNRLDNLDLAKTMFVEGKFNAKPISDYIESLSDEKLAILVQLDENAFDNGIEGVEKAIADFKADPDNTVEAETDTSSLDDLKKAYEDISKSADGFIKNQKTLTTALDEQKKHSQLSASTIRELSEAGYSEALVTDTVTGAVTLNMQAYEKLNAQKQEKIRLDLVNEKNSLEDKLKDEEAAVSDLRQEYEALAKVSADINADRLSQITLELAKRGTNIEDIRGLITQINGDITSLDAPTFENDSTDKNKEAFDKLYSQWNHDVEMNRVTQDEYINWLDGAYKQYFSDLTKYQDEYNKYEEEVYKYRTEREQKLFDKKIDNLEKLADKALDDKIEIPDVNKELEEFNKKMQSEYGLGNVDLTKRPKVAMDDGSTATVLSSSEFLWQGDEENGEYVAVHYTPILPDGTILDDDTLAKYLYETLEGSDDILKADTKGLVLKVDTGLGITDEDFSSLETDNPTQHIQDIIKACDDWDVALHNIQEQWLDVSEAAENATTTATNKFDYAREQINSAITETQARIDGIKNGTISGDNDDIEQLTDDLDSLYDKLTDINEKEIDSQKEYIKTLKDEYSDLIDEQIDQQKKLADNIEKAFEKQIDNIDKQIDAINKVNEAEERQKDILEAQEAVKEAQRNLDKASVNNRLVYVGNGGYELRSDKDAVEEAKKTLADKQAELQKAMDEQKIAVLEEQKESLETQKNNSKDYYDKVVDDLEEQKTVREKQYDLLIDIYEQLGGEKKQTSLNDSLVSKLTANGDINKAVQGLTPTEMQKAITSGILTTDSEGNYAVDYSILGDNEKAVNDNTAELQKTKSELEKLNSSISGDTSNTNPSATSKVDATKPHLDANGYLVDANGKQILNDGKPIHAKNFSEEIAKKKTNEKVAKAIGGVGKFAGYETMNDLFKAMSLGEFTIPQPVADSVRNPYLNNRITENLTKAGEQVMTHNTVNNAPNINLTMNVSGSVDKKVIPVIQSEINKSLLEYTDYMTRSFEQSFFRQMNKSRR